MFYALMYRQHPSFETPPDATPIWRYMDFAKFVSLLEYSSLFFPNALKLAEIDPFEGSYARPNLEYDPSKDPAIKSFFPGDGEAYKKVRATGLKSSRDIFSRGIFISSWYINAFESAAMWKCYAAYPNGIAVRSTVGRMKMAVEKTVQEIYIGTMKYIDYEMEPIPETNVFNNFLHKRKSFEHEKELRVIFYDGNLVEKYLLNPPEGVEAAEKTAVRSGVEIPLDVDVLIEGVFISPTTSDWVKKLVETLVAKHNLAKTVSKSSLADPG